MTAITDFRSNFKAVEKIDEVVRSVVADTKSRATPRNAVYAAAMVGIVSLSLVMQDTYAMSNLDAHSVAFQTLTNTVSHMSCDPVDQAYMMDTTLRTMNACVQDVTVQLAHLDSPTTTDINQAFDVAMTNAYDSLRAEAGQSPADKAEMDGVWGVLQAIYEKAKEHPLIAAVIGGVATLKLLAETFNTMVDTTRNLLDLREKYRKRRENENDGPSGDDRIEPTFDDEPEAPAPGDLRSRIGLPAANDNFYDDPVMNYQPANDDSYDRDDGPKL